ncbi:glycosyltransferase family 9 protein [Longimicrobium sp.]|uniref:glycosyltransferase family 9 protein n=1 Tax=Longimicrobium sp. TaxID=2029185 RepID=UPI003B3A04B1
MLRPVSMPRALVAAAAGLGDVLRATPLVRVLAGLGYDVDLLVAPDYAGVAALLRGAPEIRRLFVTANPAPVRGMQPAAPRLEGLADTRYDVAVFTYWARRLRGGVHAARTLEFDAAQWMTAGDSACVERMARALGWTEAIPAPLAVASGRVFDDLAPGTIALHPGCKAGWPWKKWHGFPELAAEFPHVVLVGGEEDRRTDGTYFRRPYEWPAHVRDFTGALSLPDTAALLAGCAALVSNDSGLMHLGVALGIPVFGVFGITSPAREAIPAPNMLPVTRGLDCEAACRRERWGRRDCHRHLECLRTLTGRDVADRVRAALAHPGIASTADGGIARSPTAVDIIRPVTVGEDGDAAAQRTGAPHIHRSTEAAPAAAAESASRAGMEPGGHIHGISPSRPMSELSLTYHGYVSDHSGYGHAARAYVHALHRAGVRVSVVDLARRRHIPPDPLVAKLAGTGADADIHLFHGIPAQWGRLAFPLRNAVGMTVWETDTMPSQWRNALNHVRDVWLPCAANVEAFARELEPPVFCLPHAVFPPVVKGAIPAPERFLGVDGDAFVFYAVFEWQDRKGPRETLDAYLSAFSAADRTVLVLKTGTGADDAARAALADARARHRSDARVEIRAEAWSEAGVEALHRRGDCYVSLHRGEGWGYPLFEAASRGKAVVATGYSGPLDYLDPAAHGLVRWTPEPVRQPYAYYHPRMSWAMPDAQHAAVLMRAAYEQRAHSAPRTAEAGARIRERFSLDAVGAAARTRLEEVLQRIRPARASVPAAAVPPAAPRSRPAARPAVAWMEGPVPVEWYDQDYFETGKKSNWDRGYSWEVFGGLFRETAAYLTELLPDATRWMDAGCARGLLVRALRERGAEAWGVDGSPWSIEHADPLARPYLARGDVATYDPDRDYDVVTAFNLLAHLTEEQALAFLTRIRPRVGTALLAVIPTVAEGKEMPGNRDPSHVTRQTRAWWMERFRRAGWTQDPLHRIAERAFREHPLPRRMGWEIFLFAPGPVAATTDTPVAPQTNGRRVAVEAIVATALRPMAEAAHARS